jgi:hypothetical protein
LRRRRIDAFEGCVYVELSPSFVFRGPKGSYSIV